MIIAVIIFLSQSAELASRGSDYPPVYPMKDQLTMKSRTRTHDSPDGLVYTPPSVTTGNSSSIKSSHRSISDREESVKKSTIPPLANQNDGEAITEESIQILKDTSTAQ